MQLPGACVGGQLNEANSLTVDFGDESGIALERRGLDLELWPPSPKLFVGVAPVTFGFKGDAVQCWNISGGCASVVHVSGGDSFANFGFDLSKELTPSSCPRPFR
jgi:hypothetical protein